VDAEITSVLLASTTLKKLTRSGVSRRRPSVCGSVTHQPAASTLAQAPIRRVNEQVDERLKALELVDHSNRSTATS